MNQSFTYLKNWRELASILGNLRADLCVQKLFFETIKTEEKVMCIVCINITKFLNIFTIIRFGFALVIIRKQDRGILSRYCIHW